MSFQQIVGMLRMVAITLNEVTRELRTLRERDNPVTHEACVEAIPLTAEFGVQCFGFDLVIV